MKKTSLSSKSLRSKINSIVRLKSTFSNSSHMYKHLSAITPTFWMRFFIIVLAFVTLFIIGKNSFNSHETKETVNASTMKDKTISDTKQILNRTFNFSIKNEYDVEIGKVSYTIEEAMLQKEIVLQLKKASAVNGKVFLILNLKLTNNDNKSVFVNARDYVRLSVNGEKEWLAPDIYNDPVEVQAISTKQTRVGFPINTTDKNLVLQVGEIKGQKTQIKLNLQ